MHSKLMHSKACDRWCPAMHSKGKTMPWCLGSINITSFKVHFNFIVVLPLTIGNVHLRVVLLAKHICSPFNNGSSTVRSLVHIFVWVLDDIYGWTYFHIDVRMVLGCQVKIVQDNPLVIHHALCLWIYKNVSLTTSIFGIPVNITTRFFAKETRVPFFALSLFHALCIEKICTTWPMHHARNDYFIRLRMVYWVRNLGQYHRIVILDGAQFQRFI